MPQPLTPQQNGILTFLEEWCHEHQTTTWVGLLRPGQRDILNQLEQRGYIAPYVQVGNAWTIMPTRAHGEQRDAVLAQYE